MKEKNGILSNVNAFYRDVRTRYTTGEIRDYDGPNLDWNLYYLEIINAQLARRKLILKHRVLPLIDLRMLGAQFMYDIINLNP